MAVTNPKRSDLTAYAGNTFDFLYTFEDQNGSAIDLSADYNDIEFRIFKSGSKSSPEVSLTVSGGGLSITNTNELSGTITASDTDSMPSVVWYEIEFTLSDGSSEVYLFGRFFVNNFTDDGEKTAEFTITINQNTNDVTFSESYDAAAKATQAKVDAETSETNAADSANDAEKQAQNTTSFTDSDGDSFNKGAKGYANDASTSATNASNSETESQDNADDAEKYAINTTQFTDSDGNTRDKGAKGYANDAQTSANNAEADAEQEVIKAHGYYSKELSNRHKIEDPLVLPEEDPSNIMTPPSGFATLFFDSTNANALSKKDSSGTTTTI